MNERNNRFFVTAVLLALVTAPAAVALGALGSTATSDVATLEDGRVLTIIGFFGDPPVGVGETLFGAEVLATSTVLDFVTVATETPEAVIDAATEDGRVKYVELDSPTAIQAHLTPNDALYPLQWGYRPTPGINAEDAWDAELGSTSIRVAIVDSGVDDTHPDLPMAVAQSYCPLIGPCIVMPVQDDCPHGTHVAGTVAAITDNLIGVAGTAQVSLIDVKVLNQIGISCSTSFTQLALAIQEAVSLGAHVVQMSIGGPSGSFTLLSAVNFAWSSGSVVVASAGNSGCPGSGSSVGFPGAYTNAIAVSALSAGGPLAGFSSCGPEVDIAAPGANIWSTLPGASYGPLSGTSMAAPHVSGVAALVWSFDPTLTNTGVRSALEGSAVNTPLPARDEGFGNLNACLALGAVGATVSCTPGNTGALPRTFTETYVNAGGDALQPMSVNSGDPMNLNGGRWFMYGNENTVTFDVTDGLGQPVGYFWRMFSSSGTLASGFACSSAGPLVQPVPAGTEFFQVFLDQAFVVLDCGTLMPTLSGTMTVTIS